MDRTDGLLWSDAHVQSSQQPEIVMSARPHCICAQEFQRHGRTVFGLRFAFENDKSCGRILHGALEAIPIRQRQLAEHIGSDVAYIQHDHSPAAAVYQQVG